MRFANEGSADRAIRMLVGIVLLYAALDGFAPGTIGVVMMAVGAVALATGIIGYCPAYTLFHLSTRHAAR